MAAGPEPCVDSERTSARSSVRSSARSSAMENEEMEEETEHPAVTNGLPSDVDTIIIVDVDGVLNVGAADDGKTPILFNDTNLRFARNMWNTRDSHPERATIEKLVGISKKRMGGEFAITLIAKSPSHISKVLVGRLADILKVAGPKAITVLSSTWQKDRHKGRLLDLQGVLSRSLGRAFEFDDTTGSSEEKTAEGRLAAISSYVGRVTRPGGAAAAAAEAGYLRVLVLEDFFITPLTGSWSFAGQLMDSEAAVEEHIRRQLPPSSTAQVKLIHTYQEWSSEEAGMNLRCGVGLSPEDVKRSKAFLKKDTLLMDFDSYDTSSVEEVEEGPDVVQKAVIPESSVSTFLGLSCFNSQGPVFPRIVSAI